MGCDELNELTKNDLNEIGAHTVGHPKLSLLSVEDQVFEIRESKRQLEEVVGKKIKSFAYPFGGTDDYSLKTIALLKENGFDSACSAMPGCVRPGVDSFQLPRFFIRNWDREEFARQLACFRTQ